MSNTQNIPAASTKLTRADLFSMVLGQIIGVGIMTMTGIAIGFTGRSVNLAYLVAGVITIVSSIPQIYIGGTADFLGGHYSQIAMLSGQKLAGIYTYINLSMALSLSMYTVSFCEYFLAIIPGANARLIGVGVLSILFLMHLIGVKQAANLQNLMCVILSVAIASYVIFGIPIVEQNYFKSENFMSGGVGGFVLASIYLTLAADGAIYVVNYSSEAKNPTKDIPFVIVAVTGIIVVLYAIMATIAAGVLPVEEVANKPLSVSAAVFMPKSGYTFFVVGGAMFALLTTLNFSIGMMVYPAERACKDGWLPPKLASRNKRFGTPHWILLAFYIIGIIPILLELDIRVLANNTVILTTCVRGVIAYSALQLPLKMPELWEKSKFHVSDRALKTISGVTIILAATSVVMLFVLSSPEQIIGNILILVFSVVLALWRNKKVQINKKLYK